MRHHRILALFAAMAVCVPAFGAALSLEAIEPHVGLLTIGNATTDNGLSSPQFLLGASAQLKLDSLSDPWVLGLGLDFFGAWYEWNDVDRRADLSEPEAGFSFFTVGVLISPRIGARFALSEAVDMGAYFGMDLLIRFPFYPFASVPIVDEQLPALLYFLAGRFLYPEIGAWLTWQATKDVELGFALRSLWPLYRIWSPEVTGFSTFFHQAILAGTLGMTIRLQKPIGGEKGDAPVEEPVAP